MVCNRFDCKLFTVYTVYTVCMHFRLEPTTVKGFDFFSLIDYTYNYFIRMHVYSNVHVVHKDLHINMETFAVWLDS